MNEIYYQAKNGLQYKIAIDDFGNEIEVYLDDKIVGSISLNCISDDEMYSECNIFKITHLALDNCKGVGIGRRSLELHIELFDSILTAGNAYDGRQSDGSHLTGDGPGFISKMRDLKIVCAESSEFTEDEEDDYS